MSGADTSGSDIHAADEKIELRYHDPTHNEEKRIVASPYYGDYQEAVDAETWIVTYEERTPGTKEWDRYGTDYASEKPEFTDV